MEKRTTQQNRVLHSLLSTLKINDDHKELIVLEFTNGRTSKSSEMSKTECDAMIRKLQSEKDRRYLSSVIESRLNKKRRRVFALFHDLGYINSSMTTAEKLSIIGAWLQKKTKFETSRLNDLGRVELEALINQMQAVKRNVKTAEKQRNSKRCVSAEFENKSVFKNGICLN